MGFLFPKPDQQAARFFRFFLKNFFFFSKASNPSRMFPFQLLPPIVHKFPPSLMEERFSLLFLTLRFYPAGCVASFRSTFFPPPNYLRCFDRASKAKDYEIQPPTPSFPAITNFPPPTLLNMVGGSRLGLSPFGRR